MSRISRYVFGEILGPTLLGLMIYGAVLVMNLMLQAAELFIRRDLPLAIVVQYMVLSLPRILVLVIPMAVLLGVLVGIGRLSVDSEITALRACGYSDRRLLVPVLLLGGLATLASGALFNFAVPSANYAQHRLNATIFLSADINREVQPRVFYEKIPDLLIYADEASPENGTLGRVLIYQKGPSGGEDLSSAQTVSMHHESMLGEIEFRMDGVVSHAWQSRQPDLYQVTRSEAQVIRRPPDLFMQEMIRSLSSPPPRNLREQTVPELLRTLGELRSQPDSQSLRRQIGETLVEVHKKVSLPTTSFVFALLGLPLALGRRASSGRAWGFVISLLVIVISYALLTAGERLADSDRLDPAVAMWAGNVLLFVVGVLMLATRHRLGLPTWLSRRAAPQQPSSDAETTPHAEPGSLNLPSPGPPRRRFVLTIERYLLQHMVIFSAWVALSLVVLFSLFYAVELIDDFSRGDKPFVLLLPYLMYVQPQVIFAYVAPVSLCIGTLISFAVLARTHELTAIRAGGIGLFRVGVPFITASAIVAAISFVAHDRVLPYSNQMANQIRDQIRNRSPRSYRQPERRWVFGTDGLLFNFSDFNAKKREFHDLAIFRFRPGTFEIDERLFAARASWQDGAWMLQDGWLRRFAGGREEYEPFPRLSFVEGMDPPEYFTQDWKAPDQMNFGELRRHVRDLETRGYDTRELRVGLYRKLTIPSVCIVMVLTALPFAVSVERRGAVFAIGISILLVFVYYGVMQAFGKLGEVGVLWPSLAAWAPSLFFAGVGILMSLRARW